MSSAAEISHALVAAQRRLGGLTEPKGDLEGLKALELALRSEADTVGTEAGSAAVISGSVGFVGPGRNMFDAQVSSVVGAMRNAHHQLESAARRVNQEVTKLTGEIKEYKREHARLTSQVASLRMQLKNAR